MTISACLSTTNATNCAANPLLQAVVVFDDYPPGGTTVYTGACTTYCGEGAILESWDWSSKAGLTTPLPNTISITSTQPSIPLVGTTYQTYSSATSGTIAVTSATTSICTVNASALVSFIANGVCTINFSDAGNANYLAAATQSQTMTVGPVANTITVNSTASSPTQGGATYTTVSSATSGDSVTVTSATTGVCTVSAGVVTFVGNGTCTLNFNDPGNTSYQAAPQVQQTFSVVVGTPAGLSVLGNASPQNGYPNNGDSVVYTYNQTMNGSSLLSGFTGSSTAVYVQLTRGSSSSPTSWQVCSTSNCSTVVKLGTVTLGDSSSGGYYIASGSTAYFNATMLMSTNTSGESVVTVTLGSLVSGTLTALSPTTTQTTLTWTPSSSATSTATSTACATTAVTEVNAPKANF